jgi:glycine oxidase
MNFDVVIIGGGVIGCSAAYHLAQKKIKVLVIEKMFMGSQASGVAAGMLAAQCEAEAPDAFLDLCVRSRAMFKSVAPQLREQTGLDPHWDICGIWHVAKNEREATALQEKVAWQKRYGLNVQWHDSRRVAEELPRLSPSAGGLFCPEDGQVDAALWVSALVLGAKNLGVSFRENVPQVDIDVYGGRVRGVRLPSESISSRQVLVAAGAWTPLLLKPLNVDLPLEPIKGQVVILSGERGLWSPSPVYGENGYLVPKADGRIMIGATVERVGFDTSPTLEARQELMAWVDRWCPDLSRCSIVECQGGLRPGSSDGWPILGPVASIDGLSVAAGHFRNGILLSPITGHYMADGLADGRWHEWGRPFSPERFCPKEAALP